MDLTFNCKTAYVSADTSRTVTVEISEADDIDILNHFEIGDVVDHFKKEAMLDHIWKDTIMKYFDLKEKE